jgi:surface antigen
MSRQRLRVGHRTLIGRLSRRGAEEDLRHEVRTQRTVTTDGKPQTLIGTVCTGPDGNWHRVQ